MLKIKNLTKEIFKNKIFLLLLTVMTAFTSLLFFFIRFSIDANMANLKGLEMLTENQQNYMNALKSNTFLSIIILLVFSVSTALVFAMFYFRFYSSAKKQLGILKALGAKNIEIQLFFLVFTAIFSLAGLLPGMLAGYFLSSIPMSANARSYNVSGLVKGIDAMSVLFGFGLPLLIFAITMFFCSFNIYIKDNAALLSDVKQSDKPSKVLKFADACVKKLPIKNKAPLRIALRKPFSILLIITASMVFTVMLVLGWSITQSSETVYKTQTEGHNYFYEATFESYVTERTDGDALYYLSVNGLIPQINDEREQTLLGIDNNDGIYSLKNASGEKLGQLEDGMCYLPIGLSEMYDIKTGGKIVFIANEKEMVLRIKDVAYNAKSKTIIVSREYLADLLELDALSYNGVLSIDNLYPNADKITDVETKMDALSRDKVSSATSAIINQTIGLTSGIILIFLALFITFQDSIKDILIMNSLGYRKKEIKKLLLNVFLPILIVSFILTAFPSILIAKGIQTSLALQMGDYMPFSTNVLVLLVGFLIIGAIYWLTQLAFNLGIKHITKKKGILEYTNSI